MPVDNDKIGFDVDFPVGPIKSLIDCHFILKASKCERGLSRGSVLAETVSGAAAGELGKRTLAPWGSQHITQMKQQNVIYARGR